MDWSPMIVGALGAVVTWLGIAISLAGGPVDRRRVERFAQRHDLTVTVDNGPQIIRYLAATRRWRAAGISAGFLVSVGWALPDDAIRVGFLHLLAGWFAGAVVAETRLAGLASGDRRAASLVPRTPAAYLPRAAWGLPPVAAGLSVIVGAVAVAVGAPLGWEIALTAVALAIVVLVRRTQRRVLRRPQPLAAPDVLAADDAVRSRSLHVLAGGGAALALYCVLGQLRILAPALPEPVGDTVTAAWLVGGFAVPVLGWVVATARWPVRRADGAAPAFGRAPS